MPAILYLSAEMVTEARVAPDELREALAAAYAAKARGAVHTVPKVAVTIGRGHSFQAMPVADAALAALKWVAVIPPREGAVPISALVLLADVVTGEPVAIMDGAWITAARTAAMSALAASHLAWRDASAIGFIGCGVQARSHLAALRCVLPKLERVIAYSRTEASAARFAAEASDAGLEAEATANPRDAVAGLEVVVTSVPDAPGFAPFLDPAWLAPGAFVAAVDLGRSWQPGAIRALDLVATDDHRQSETLGAAGKLAFAGPFDADLAELASGAKSGRTGERQRAMFLFAGDALADLAAARLVYEAARRRGLGMKLPR